MPFDPKFIDLRVQRRLAELGQHTVTGSVPVATWTVSEERPGDIPPLTAAAYIEPGPPNAGAQPPDATPGSWPDPHAHVRLEATETRLAWCTAEVTVPEAMEGQPVRLLLQTNGEGLLYLDGVPWQGLDENHTTVRLAVAAEAGRVVRLVVALFTGRSRQDITLAGHLAVPDTAVEAYRYDLQAAAGAARTLPDHHPTAVRLWQTLARSMDVIDFHGGPGPVDVTHAAALLREHLAALRAEGQGPTAAHIFAVGNSHIDVAWLWTIAETRHKMGRTTATALRLMEAYPDYRFAQSQAQLYAFLRDDFPDLFAQVQRRVTEGRWEAIGAMWVEPDCNISGGEALVRQILYGQQFWKKHFGQTSEVCWLPDTFGYSSALPQICRKSGLTHFVTQKLSWSETNIFPHGHFDWEGIDGTRIRCTFAQAYWVRLTPEDIAERYRAYPSKDVVPALLYPYGYGDGGGGPIAEDVELARRLERMPDFPQVHLLPAEEALREIADRADALGRTYHRDVPVWKGELYLEFHRGTLTTHARIKRANRRCERLLREAEVWASLAAIRAGQAYPAERLEAAWKQLLLNQFHDIVPGTSIPPVYEEAHRRYDDIEATTEAIINEALHAALPMQDDGAALTICNSLSWPIADWVEAAGAWDEPFHLVDAEGMPVPFQIVAREEGRVRIGWEAEVPALGAATYRIVAEEPAEDDDVFFTSTPENIETPRYHIVLDTRGRLTSVVDKLLEREWLAGPANVLQTFDDRPNNWEAWDVNDWYENAPLDLLTCEDITVAEVGPVRVVVRMRHTSPNGSVIEQDLIAYRTLPRIDVVTRADWQEERVLLKAAFPVAVHSPTAHYEVQFGALGRSTGRNTSWDAAKFEVCGHRWTDLSDATGGVSLLNDGQYGHDIHDHTMRITLLRNPAYPDPRRPHPSYLFGDQDLRFTDTGTHTFRYAMLPHAGDWRTETVRQAHAFNGPLRVRSGRCDGGDERALRIEPSAVVLETLKQAEDGDGWILRCYEAHGGQQDARLRLPFAVAAVETVDLMERPDASEGPAVLDDERVLRCTFRPYEIRTFRLRLAA